MRLQGLQSSIIEQIADAIINFLTDENESERIIQAIKRAGIGYTQSKNWWIISYGLSFFRSRVDLAVQTEENLRKRPDNLLLRLTSLEKIFADQEGGWKSTSYNTYLLVYLLGILDECEHPTQNRFYYLIIEDLAEVLKQKLKVTIEQYRAANKEILAKRKELQQVPGNASIAPKILINPKAQELSDPRSVFVLKHAEQELELSWYNGIGCSHEIDLDEYPELKAYLLRKQKLNEKDIPDLLTYIQGVKVTGFKSIKHATQRLEEFFRGDKDLAFQLFDLLINPSSSQLSELCSTFVLTRNKETCQLTWYDALGEGRSISLKNYPPLETWLQKHPVMKPGEDLELKKLLVDVETSKRLDRDEFKVDLARVLAMRKADKESECYKKPVGRLNLQSRKYTRLIEFFADRKNAEENSKSGSMVSAVQVDSV